jgi:hypothetical protein
MGRMTIPRPFSKLPIASIVWLAFGKLIVRSGAIAS